MQTKAVMTLDPFALPLTSRCPPKSRAGRTLKTSQSARVKDFNLSQRSKYGNRSC